MKRMDKYVWKWIPLRSVGFVVFGEDAEEKINQFNLVKLDPPCESADWETYELLADETRVTVENGKFVSVLCDSNLYYNEKDLIGISIEEIREILGKEDEIEKDVGDEDAVYYYQLGLTLWMKNRYIVGATCDGPERLTD